MCLRTISKPQADREAEVHQSHQQAHHILIDPQGTSKKSSFAPSASTVACSTADTAGTAQVAVADSDPTHRPAAAGTQGLLLRRVAAMLAPDMK